MTPIERQRRLESEQAVRDRGWEVRASRDVGISIGKIQMLQELLGIPLSEIADVNGHDDGKLNKQLRELEHRFRSRLRHASRPHITNPG